MEALLQKFILLIVVFSFITLSFPAKAAAPPLKVGDIMVDFTLPEKGESSVSFNNDIKCKSKVTVLSFIASFCSACKAELILLSDLANKYPNEVKVYAIVVDMTGPGDPKYSKASAAYKVEKYLLDYDLIVAPLLGVPYSPSLAILDKDGKILFIKYGLRGGGDLKAESKEITDAVEDALKLP